MQSHSKCLVRHILVGQNIVSSVRAYKNSIADGEMQHWGTRSHVHPVKAGIAAGTCRHGVHGSAAGHCCREAWEHRKRVIASALTFCKTAFHWRSAVWFVLVEAEGINWLGLHDFAGLVVSIPFGTAAGFTQSWTGYTTELPYKCLFPNLQLFCRGQTHLLPLPSSGTGLQVP